MKTLPKITIGLAVACLSFLTIQPAVAQTETRTGTSDTNPAGMSTTSGSGTDTSMRRDDDHFNKTSLLGLLGLLGLAVLKRNHTHNNRADATLHR